MENDKEFIPQKGGYRDLIAFQKATCIYDITYYFAHKFLERTDRTVDQMIQAARSGRQNIAEGSAAATTSRETELKLTNVAVSVSAMQPCTRSFIIIPLPPNQNL